MQRLAIAHRALIEFGARKGMHVALQRYEVGLVHGLRDARGDVRGLCIHPRARQSEKNERNQEAGKQVYKFDFHGRPTQRAISRFLWRRCYPRDKRLGRRRGVSSGALQEPGSPPKGGYTTMSGGILTQCSITD